MSHMINIAGNDYCLDNDRLYVYQQDDKIMDICLSPVLDGQTVKIKTWEKIDYNSYQASLGKYGQAFVCEKFDKLAFWIETPIKQFENVTYLSDGVISGGLWRTFVSDEHERLWDKQIDTNIPISSAYAVTASPDGATPGGMTDPDDVPIHWIWNVHVRAFAFKGIKDRWLGVSIPGPWGIGVARLNMHKERFNLRFESLQTGCTDGKMPVIYFCPALAGDLEILDEHRSLSESLGLMDLRKKEIPEWWTNPWQGSGDEWYRYLHEGLITKEEGNILDYLEEWIDKTRETTGIHDFNTNMEQGCFKLYGDYRPADNMGSEANMRARIDNWRKDGIRAGLYIHPFIVNTKVKFFKDHPEAFCKPKDPGFLMGYACEQWDEDPQFAPIDWTHPLGRKFILDWVEYILSDKDGCMNFDILRSNHWRSPDPRKYNFHDPDWGVGDMMTYKVQKLLYEKAKQTKPDCMVTKIAAMDCYMQPTYDAMQMSEDWAPTMNQWYRRAQLATRLHKNSLLYTDPWFVTRTKWNEFYTSFLTVSIPECQGVTHTTHIRFPRWMPLEQRHLQRRKMGYHIYLNARPDPSDELRLTWTFDTYQAYRRRTQGPLKGWYAALALGTRSVVSYNETQALVGSSEDRLCWVPLPPNAKLEKVTRLLHDGTEEEYEYVTDEKANRIQLYIEDAGKQTMYYRLKYKLSK